MKWIKLLFVGHVIATCFFLTTDSRPTDRPNRHHRKRHRKNEKKHAKQLRMLHRTIINLKHPQNVLDMVDKRREFSKKGEGRLIRNENKVPVIECPTAEDGLQLLACPTPDKEGKYHCIDDHALCDRVNNCPNNEDEDPTACMFNKMTMNYFNVLLDTITTLSQNSQKRNQRRTR